MVSGVVRTLGGVKDSRFELRVESGWLERVDAARGGLSRAAFITRAVDEVLAARGIPVASKVPVRDWSAPLRSPALERFRDRAR